MFVFQSRQDSTNLKEELEKSRGSAEVGQACNWLIFCDQHIRFHIQHIRFHIVQHIRFHIVQHIRFHIVQHIRFHIVQHIRFHIIQHIRFHIVQHIRFHIVQMMLSFHCLMISIQIWIWVILNQKVVYNSSHEIII